MAYQSEIEKLEQRFREKPEQWFAALADAYRKAGDLELALDLVRTWAEKRPNYSSGLIVLGRCLVDRKDDAEAAEAFERVLAIDAENIIALKSLSDIAIRRSDPGTARHWLQRLMEVDPMNDEARATLEELALLPASSAPAAPAPSRAAPPSAQPGEEKAEAEDDPDDVLGGIAIERPGQEARESAPAMPPEEFELEKSDAADLPETGIASEAAALAAMEPGVGGAGARKAGEGDAGEPAEAGGEGGDEVIGGELEFMAFDERLDWDAGETMSHQITEEVLDQIADVHEKTLDPPVHALPGLETTEVPDIGRRADEDVAAEAPPEPEEEAAAPEPEEEAAEPEPVSAAAPEPEEPEVELPLILPEELGAATDAAEPEVDPVVTETMAQLYARQGHYAEAGDIYRQLAERRPDDPALVRRAAEMEAAARSSGEHRAPARAKRSSLGVTRGESARALLRGILSARPSGDTAATRRATPAPAPPPSGGAGLLDDIFADDAAGAVPGGEPAREAEEELSLESVFGDDEGDLDAPSAHRDVDVPPRSSGRTGGPPEAAFSFDQFFGAAEESAGGAEGGQGGGEDEDDFKDWLKGLKS